MSKIRVCPKCGKIESQFIYFCTECGWQTKVREMQNDYSTEQISEKVRYILRIIRHQLRWQRI